MNPCTRCGDTTHRDFPDKREHCSGCDRIPAFCRCLPVKAERLPEWIVRRNEHRLPAKELVA